MTDLQNLLIRKANVTARLAAMTEGAIGDKPDANTAAGTPIGPPRWFGPDGVEHPAGGSTDFDGDGRADRVLDTDRDGLADRVLHTGDDGRFDAGYVDTDGDGRWDLRLVDTDGDGAADDASVL